ncbi:MAG: phosphatase PAP2 family protein [Gaiellaceae bacterium]
MAALFETLLAWDSAASALGEQVRWEPLTFVFLLASAWWVKWPLIAAVGSAVDAKRWRFPRATCAAALAVTSAALLVTMFKELVDRVRPPVANPALDPVGLVPASASFPSGHAATAFAAAVAVAVIHPRLRVPLLALAAVVALSRVYLGVHYVLDVAVGTALGIAVGFAAAWLTRAVAARSGALVRSRTSASPT